MRPVSLFQSVSTPEGEPAAIFALELAMQSLRELMDVICRLPSIDTATWHRARELRLYFWLRGG